MIRKIAASRATSGNFFFPTELEFTGERVIARKRSWFSNYERAIPLSKVACVSVRRGLFFADIRVESSGGVEDIVGCGFRRDELPIFKQAIESALQVGPRPSLDPFATTASKQCPFCAERIQRMAIKCRYCGEMIDKLGTTNVITGN